jgi:hypothetical protein
MFSDEFGMWLLSTKIFGSAGAMPSRKTIRCSPIVIRYRFGRKLALSFRTPTEVGGYEKQSLLKQAN